MAYKDNKDENKNSKKILTIFILIFTLIVCITGATYAYFAISATDNTTITGTAASSNLELSVTRETPDDTNWNTSNKKMIPQLTEALGSAISDNHKCIDGNNNIVCEVFKIVVTNKSTTAVNLRGTIHFNYATENDVFNNLYWQQIENENTLGSGYTQFKASSLEETESLTPKEENSRLINNLNLVANTGTETFYVVVWIEETDRSQNTTDTGTFTATIKFTDQLNPNKGITSTITS